MLAQRSVRQFLEVVSHANEQIAIESLRKSGGNVQQAVDYYFEHEHDFARMLKNANPKKIDEMFDNFKKTGINGGADPSEDSISGPGLSALADALGIDITSMTFVFFCYLSGCAQNYCIQRVEFLLVCQRLSSDTIGLLSKNLTIAEKNYMSNATLFKQFYVYCFSFMKDPSQKSMAPDVAAMAWPMLLSPRYTLLSLWIEFVSQVYKKAVSKDTWTMFLDFIIAYPLSVANYKEDLAWPSVIDEYVEWVQKQPQYLASVPSS
eukprot:ANDGO_05494.mRNA.1 hypothetical protein